MENRTQRADGASDMCEWAEIRAHKIAMKSNQSQMHSICSSSSGLGHPKNHTSEGLRFSSRVCGFALI